MDKNVHKFKPIDPALFAKRRAECDVRWRRIVHGGTRPFVPGEADYRPRQQRSRSMTREEIVSLIRDVLAADLADALAALRERGPR
jgi:hypothetical protein